MTAPARNPADAPRSEAYERLQETATPAEVRKLAQAMDDNMLLCRRLRQHRWEPSTVQRVREGRSWVYQETLVCGRCTTEKDVSYSNRGSILGASMRYAEGYLLEGVGRMDHEGRDVLRLESLQRLAARAGQPVVDLRRGGSRR